MQRTQTEETIKFLKNEGHCIDAGSLFRQFRFHRVIFFFIFARPHAAQRDISYYFMSRS